jgi:hypothetical protein
MRAWTSMSIIGHLGKIHHGNRRARNASINYTSLDVFGIINKDEAPGGGLVFRRPLPGKELSRWGRSLPVAGDKPDAPAVRQR